MEYKAVPFLDLKIEDERVVKSIFAVMGNADSYNDVIMPGAFKKTIRERLPKKEIKVLWQHDLEAPPIGTVLSLKELGKDDLPDELRKEWPEATGALYGEIRYLDTPRGNEILTGIKAEAVTENSIGFDSIKRVVEEPKDEEPGVFVMPKRKLLEVRLWDVSPVNWGANSATMNVKQAAEQHIAQLANLPPDMQRKELAYLLQELKRDNETPEIITAIDRVLSVVTAEPPKSAPDTALTVLALMQRMAIAEREAMFVS